jgi:hypothetical protein
MAPAEEGVDVRGKSRMHEAFGNPDPTFGGKDCASVRWHAELLKKPLKK